MNLEELRSNYVKLLEFMEKSDYSKDYVTKVRCEIERTLREAPNKDWNSYYDIYQEYTQMSLSKQNLRNKRTLLGMIEHFDIYGKYPDRRRRQKIVRRDSYSFLRNEFKEIIDYYRAAEKKRGKKESVIYGESHNASTFLRTLQEKGIYTPKEITEEAVLSVFLSSDGSIRRSASYKKNIRAVFKACIPKDPDTFNRILSFLPKLRAGRKTIQYLKPDEVIAIKQVLNDENSAFTLRNKAITTLAINTGLRMCDIAGMTKDSIDWDKDLITINQQKTGALLELPLSAVTGNAIHDYLEQERPDTESEYIFVSEDAPHKRLKSGSLGNVSDKVMKESCIRQTSGDRRGFHIFRHRLATELLGNGVARPVISRILGQEDPDSLEPYIGSDFKHLKECAISIERFPVREGVFSNA